MSQSVTSSEPSSVGIPMTTLSLAGDSITSNSFHHSHQDMIATTTAVATAAAAMATSTSSRLYPSEFAIATATAMHASMPSLFSHGNDDGNKTKSCPLCGNQGSSNRGGSYKTTGLEDEDYKEAERRIKSPPDASTNYNVNPNQSISDFELASMLQSAEIAKTKMSGNAASAAAMGACWVCVAALVDVNPNQVEQQQSQRQQLLQQYHQSFSTLENFHDEHSTTPMSPKATTLSMNAFEQDYREQMRQIQLSRRHASGGINTDGTEGGTETGGATTSTTKDTNIVYIGEYNHRGERHGPHGELIWDNGDRYVGSFVCGKRTGTGTMFHRDGSSYTGDWLNNKMHGKGQRTFANGDVYVGQYHHGERCGGPDCKLKFSNGDLYAGCWESNQFHGFGRYYFSDGTALEGNFEHGKKQGKFKRQKPSGNLDILRYENDKVVGQGVRWNESRTKTWLLRAVVDKNQLPPVEHQGEHKHHRRAFSQDSASSDSPRIRSRDHRRGISSTFSTFSENNADVGFNASEPLVQTQVMTVTKKAGRIPIAQAVSIGYDCELGEEFRESNPAFWSVGDFADGEGNRNGPNESFSSMV